VSFLTIKGKRERAHVADEIMLDPTMLGHMQVSVWLSLKS